MESSTALAPPPPRTRPSGPRKQAPRQRLQSIGSPVPGRALFVPSSPAPSISINAARPKPTYTCTNPECDRPDVIVDESGGRVCQNCGAEVAEANPYVSETTFVDGPNGASQMVGQFVAEGQTHTRSTGGVKGMSSHIGSEARPTREATIRKAADKMDGHASALGIQRNIVDQAKVIFSLALSLGFIAGRTIENVATVALYVACRRQNKQNKIMLIDLAERENVNVFDLGSMYTKMVHKMYGKTNDGFTFHPGTIDAITPESLIDRFARELDFGRDTAKIARDAVRIVARMERDWMTHGRRPAGICGAALILAARMNNYRRTVREVVLVAKVTEITLNKRLDEFKVTESSTWTVAHFRELAENKETVGEGSDRKTVMFAGTAAHDPPAFYLALQPKAPKKRGRKRKTAPESAAEMEEDGDRQHEGGDGNPAAAKRPRVDKDGFAIPALPLDPRLQQSDATSAPYTSYQRRSEWHDADDVRAEREGTAESEGSQSGERRRRGRRPGQKAWVPPPPTAAELAIEAELDADVRYGLEQAGRLTDADPAESAGSVPCQETPPRPDDATSPSAPTPADAPATRSSTIPASTAATPNQASEPAPGPDTSGACRPPKGTGPAVNTNVGNLGHVSLEPELAETEFDDDPDVSSCLLSEAEQEIKEKIWVTENADWLRKDHAKRIKHELWRAAEKAKGNDPDAPKAPKHGKRAGKIGDLTYMQGQRKANLPVTSNGAGADAADVRASLERAATESVQMMMNERAKVSRRINQNAMRALIGDDDRSSTTRSPSRSSSVSGEPSVADRPHEMTDDGIHRYDADGKRRSLASIASERRERIKRARRREQREKEGSVMPVASSASPAPASAPSPARPRPSARTSARPSPSPSPAPSASSGPNYQAQVANRMRTEKQHLPTPSESQAQHQPSVEHLRTTRGIEDAGVEEELGTVDSPLSSLPSNLDSPMVGLPSHGGFAADAGDEDDDGESEAGDYVDDEDDGVEDAFQGHYHRPGRVDEDDDESEDE